MASTKLLAPALGLVFAASFCAPACADRIAHPTAVFSGLDKITGRIISFEVAANETVQFGSLQITEKACYMRPATEAPQTTTFTQVDEIDAKKQYKRIFSGWMFASMRCSSSDVNERRRTSSIPSRMNPWPENGAPTA